VVLGLVAVVGVVFARSVTRPVRRLEQASRRLAAGDLAARVDVSDGPSELRSLAETFNTTAQQLGQVIESQHRFVADASHQLRTPLTALRLRLETLEPFVAEPAQPKLDAAIAETDRLARLVQSLLVLARSDATRTPCEPVDVSTAVVGRLDAWGPVAAEHGVRLVADCPPAVWARAVPGAVEQILDNLVSNALDAAPNHTEVKVGITTAAGAVHLHVIDRGGGMSADAREQAFERFWRQPGRSGDGVADGFGLGLAIVDQLAKYCGGTARLDDGPRGVGLDAVITLRAAPPGTPAREPSTATADLHPALRSR
jgi:signal transduction histidine kinase